MDPRQFAVWTALGVIGFHGFNLYQCVSDLREMRKQQVEPARPTAPETALSPKTTDAVATKTIPDPARPKGAPPDVRAPAPALEQSQPIAQFKT